MSAGSSSPRSGVKRDRDVLDAATGFGAPPIVAPAPAVALIAARPRGIADLASSLEALKLVPLGVTELRPLIGEARTAKMRDVFYPASLATELLDKLIVWDKEVRAGKYGPLPMGCVDWTSESKVVRMNADGSAPTWHVLSEAVNDATILAHLSKMVNLW